jgi:SAM-dependent methyltransferase
MTEDPTAPRDHSSDPTPYELPDDRVRAAWRRLRGEYFIAPEPLEPPLARRLLRERTQRFVELGAAHGPISALLEPAGVTCIAADLNPPVDHVPRTVQGDLRALPVRNESVDAASAINCLYFLGDPLLGLSEAHRMLRSDAPIVAGTPSRYHDAELRHVLPRWGEKSSFDAEEAASIVAQVFEVEDEEWWEMPVYLLPHRRAVVDYLVAFEVPDADDRAAQVQVPTQVTKSGVNIWARKR